MQKFNDLSERSSEKAKQLHNALKEHGVNFASGVPCGVLKHIISNVENDATILHIPANRESEAVGIAAGAYLSGKTPILYMQNSGFFAASNDIASLLIPYKIPILMLVSFRGTIGETAPQHFATGKATIPLVKSLGLSYAIYESGRSFDSLVNEAFSTMQSTNLPFIILFERGWQRDE